jgi:glycerol-3-phosphate dehydrogenase
MQRSEILNRVRETKQWDMIVIGGGATGLGIAVDAAARGYTTYCLRRMILPKELPAAAQNWFMAACVILRKGT